MIEKLLKWLDNATCNFLAVETIKDELENAGFTELRQEDAWDIKPGSRYYIVKNDSAIFPFITGTGDPEESAFRIITAHSDSPCFKIKPNAEIYGEGGVVSLNVEKYGGGILYTWFDRPLSMSGRVMVDCGDLLIRRLSCLTSNVLWRLSLISPYTSTVVSTMATLFPCRRI